jgi:hypothetical protein
MNLYYGAPPTEKQLNYLQIGNLLAKLIPAVWFSISTAGKKNAPFFFIFFFCITLLPGIIFISSFFYLIGSWMIISILVFIVATVASVYPYLSVRTLVRQKDRNLTLGVIVGIVEGLNSLMTGIFMKVINPESKIVDNFSASAKIDISNYVGSAELDRVPSVIRWISFYILVTMTLGILLVKLNVSSENITEPSMHQWLRIDVTNQAGKIFSLLLTRSF